MTVRFHDDGIFCYFCGHMADVETDVDYDSVTIGETPKSNGYGTYTMFVCRKCKNEILSKAVAESFRLRYTLWSGEPWDELKDKK